MAIAILRERSDALTRKTEEFLRRVYGLHKTACLAVVEEENEEVDSEISSAFLRKGRVAPEGPSFDCSFGEERSVGIGEYLLE